MRRKIVKNFLKYSLIVIVIFIVIIAFNFQKIIVKFTSFIIENSINKQVKMQYDEKKVTKSKNDININFFIFIPPYNFIVKYYNKFK